MDNYKETGKSGPKVRSDCLIGITLLKDGGIVLDIDSKVDYIYGKSNRDLLYKLADFFELKNARIEFKDSGALPFVIMARFEATVRKFEIDKGKKLLPEFKYEFKNSSRTRFRRSRLYLPGDQTKLSLNASIHKPDGLILDLEDSVSPSIKDETRILVRNALRSIDFKDSERMVRINQLPLGLKDIEEIVPYGVHLILIPKVETADQLIEIDKRVDEIISKYEAEKEKINDIYYMPIIESAKGILNANLIAAASKRTVALAIGLEDYTADLGVERTKEGKESLFARQMIINAARANSIQAIDTVFSDVSDMDGLRDSVLEAKSLGFDGKGCIHPRQIRVVHEALSPTIKEIEKAKRIVIAADEAQKMNLGVVSLGSKMVDPPIIKRAERVIDIAKKENIIDENWRKEHEG